MRFTRVSELNAVFEKFSSLLPTNNNSDMSDSWQPRKKARTIPVGIISLALGFGQTTTQRQKWRSCLACLSVPTNVTEFATQLRATHMDTQRQTRLMSLSRETVASTGNMHFRISDYKDIFNGILYLYIFEVVHLFRCTSRGLSSFIYIKSIVPTKCYNVKSMKFISISLNLVMEDRPIQKIVRKFCF
jgi:hypothetical protein